MSFLHPTPGEAFDRLSILRLKIKACRRAKRDADGMTREVQEILDYLATQSPPTATSKLSRLIRRLDRLNQALWHAEDDVRACPTRELAAHIARTNDLRADTVRRINTACGLATTPQKIYRTRGNTKKI